MNGPRVKLDIDVTREKLTALGLGHATSALDGLLEIALDDDLPLDLGLTALR